ncbi:lmo0937 family membrane protein [Cellulophaga sp. Hel_I_12]|uniref:lmo0937 family membrane protein n=1 Tax=Cellulophaga sp. Hel_I_12 TaxID=1249972 RepID=UPI000646EFB2|nr:lmo0937 family membrane protein [Cellulophaga sp. Hel_I_12]
MNKILWILVGLLLTAWVLGFLVFKVVSVLIHIFLFLALVLILYNWFKGFKEK